MRNCFIAVLVMLSCNASAHAEDKQVSLDVASMVCGPDPHNVKSALAILQGVKDVQISLADKKATVTFDDQQLNVDKLLSAVAGAGYASMVVAK